MLNEHDQDLLLRCCRLGHEVPFGYCRQETDGKPCRLILNCWWERFDVRSFLRAHLSEEAMAQIENAHSAPPPAKLLSLMDLVEKAKERVASNKCESENPPRQS